MRHIPFLLASVVSAAVLFTLPQPVSAQGGDYFIPGQGQNAAKSAPARPARPAQRATPATPVTPAPVQLPPQPVAPPQAENEPPPKPFQLPPPPDLPPIPRGPAPPAAVIGVLGVPDVMRASTAAQQAERVIGERRDKLNEDAQKEQSAWRELQQQLANQRSQLTPEQIRTKERELQERITNAQRQFRDRNRVIQEAAQYALAQIERTLIAVIRQVAESRGMNLVLHRAQVALNVNEFDVTEQVAQQLNKVLPSVLIPPEGVSPSAMAQNTPSTQQGPSQQGAARPAQPASPVPMPERLAPAAAAQSSASAPAANRASVAPQR
ncbi:MAG: OmpH family outer membrane protein [Acetobacteraceae bacterium]|nr:OmpH family outer membrane protein [Acetobacteraceae bacterium]MBV8521399.1 OmpH family outer membrane protein [Acetobacteraceae bacterium]MBV8591774.1 OmpH family outer membrane protein [Acetobacteraceae bacterium]